MFDHTHFWIFSKFAKSIQILTVPFCFLFLSEPRLNVILSFLDQKNQENETTSVNTHKVNTPIILNHVTFVWDASVS